MKRPSYPFLTFKKKKLLKFLNTPQSFPSKHFYSSLLPSVSHFLRSLPCFSQLFSSHLCSSFAITSKNLSNGVSWKWLEARRRHTCKYFLCIFFLFFPDECSETLVRTPLRVFGWSIRTPSRVLSWSNQTPSRVFWLVSSNREVCSNWGFRTFKKNWKKKVWIFLYY